MYPTSEIRWFCPGKLPEEVIGWYQAHAGIPEDKSPRKDQYLCIPGYDTMGIKIREGNIEIKALIKTRRLFSLGENSLGYAGDWRKWSFLLKDESPPLHQLMNPASSWIEVYKKRSLLRYQITTEKNTKSISTGIPCLAGCDVELTEIFIRQDPWWSLCFEAFGPEAENHQNLDLMINSFFQPPPPFSFKSQDSFSYPELLGKYI